MAPEGSSVKFTLPSDFQDMSQNPSLWVAYRDLVPVTRLPITEEDQR